MATRQIIDTTRIKKAHVNSNDSTCTYEASTAYEAGTVVLFTDNVFYFAVVDIAADDTDTPDIAPDKWGYVFGSVMLS